MLDYWQRIEQIIKWTGVASVSAFAREIGLNRSENLYQIRRGNNGISRELADSIVAKYPKISKAWVLTGEGDMLPAKGKYISNSIPFYKMEATEMPEFIAAEQGEKQIENAPEPTHYISLPTLKECRFAALSLSNAMEPEIPQGATLCFSEVKGIDELIPGKTYLVVTRNFIEIRILRRQPNSDKIRLVAKNYMEYDDIVIDRSEIELLYLVKGIIISK